MLAPREKFTPYGLIINRFVRNRESKLQDEFEKRKERRSLSGIRLLDEKEGQTVN